MLPSSPLVWKEKESSPGGGKVGIGGADFQGAGGNLGLVFHGSVFSTAHHVRSVTNRERTIQGLMDGHGLTGQGVAPARLVELPPPIANGDGVVLADYPFGLDGEDPVQIAAPAAAERGAAQGGFHRELPIELGEVAFAQEAVGRFQRGDRSQPQRGRRACQVPKLRSLRPRACGE